jgi:lipopolysaccharide export system permease protein
MPLSAVLLSLLAIPLGRIKPREGKYARFGAAIVIYVAYRYLLGTAKSWVADGTLAVFPGLWAVHGLCLLLIFFLFTEGRRPWTAAA